MGGTAVNVNILVGVIVTLAVTVGEGDGGLPTVEEGVICVGSGVGVTVTDGNAVCVGNTVGMEVDVKVGNGVGATGTVGVALGVTGTPRRT